MLRQSGGGPGARLADYELGHQDAFARRADLGAAGVDPRRLGAVGYGEFRPVADNSTPEGRAKNRRIAITVLSDELVGADATPPKAVAPPAPAPVPVKLPEHTGPPND